MKLSPTATLVAATVIAAAVAWTAARAVGNDRVASLEAGQQEILKQLQEIKTTLSPVRQAPAVPANVAAPPLPAAPLSIAGAPSRGRKDARITIVEFSDFQCPFCGRYIRDTFAQLEKDYVDTGKVQYVFRNFPIEKLHARAFKAAEAGECANKQGKFWELHSRLFANQQAMTDLDLLASAKAVGMDESAFKQCVTGPVATKIREDLDEGARAGITGTPSFFIGTVQPDGRVKVLRRLTGAQPYSTFKSTLDALLASPDTAS